MADLKPSAGNETPESLLGAFLGESEQWLDRLNENLKGPDSTPIDCESVLAGISSMLQQAGAEETQAGQTDADRSAAPVVDPFDSVADEAEISPKYLAIFIDESELSLDALTQTLLDTEGHKSRAALESLLITSHRIKGSAASIGLNRCAKLAHLMEDLLQDLLEKGKTLGPELVDALLKCTDSLRSYIRQVKSSSKPSDHFADVAVELLTAGMRASGGPSADPSTSGTPTVATAPAEPLAAVPPAFLAQAAQAAPRGESCLVGMVSLQPNLALSNLKAQLLAEKLNNLGNLFLFDPSIQNLDDLEDVRCVHFALATDRPASVVAQQLRVGGVRRTLVEPLRSTPAVAPWAACPPAQTEQTAAPAAATSKERPDDAEGGKPAHPGEPAGSKPGETLRVDIERLDQLMNLAGQLVINRARFAQIGEGLKNSLTKTPSLQVLDNMVDALVKFEDADDEGQAADPHSALGSMRNSARRMRGQMEALRRDVASLAQARTSVSHLLEAVHQLDRVTDSIQQTVMDTRMVPIGPLLNRFRRVVRDMTRNNGRQIELVIKGEKTELDKRMIDELSDPLIHLVRNATDHGIEPPEVREAAGKPPHGTVTLNAFHRGDSILIQVSDDGKGLDCERIRRKAIDRGLISQSDAAKMTPQQIFQLIWKPGLSTAEKVTEVSGRGVGMDIVKSKIEALHGSTELESTPGQGTTLTIKLPLTLAILPSLMVEIEGDVFAMPLEAVIEIVNTAKSDLFSVHGRPTASLRGRVISVARLSEVFSWNTPRIGAETAAGNETTLVIVGERGREIGVAVDRVLGEEDVVIKSIAENYQNIAGVAGASILGDGRVSLILDIAALLEMSAGKNTIVV